MLPHSYEHCLPCLMLNLVYKCSTGDSLTGGWGEWSGVRLATHLHVMLSLRMSGAIPPVPLYVFMVCTGELYGHYSNLKILSQALTRQFEKNGLLVH